MTDEIEDFRQRLEKDLGEALNMIRALRDENEQMRIALTWLYEDWYDNYDGEPMRLEHYMGINKAAKILGR